MLVTTTKKHLHFAHHFWAYIIRLCNEPLNVTIKKIGTKHGNIKVNIGKQNLMHFIIHK
jgi:hypothetical protein